MQPAHEAYYTSAPGAVESMHCAVCGIECLVRRNVGGPTGFVMAMAKQTRLHDEFTCPHRDEKWHKQAARLYQAIQETPSPRLAALIRLDLEDVLKAHRT